MLLVVFLLICVLNELLIPPSCGRHIHDMHCCNSLSFAVEKGVEIQKGRSATAEQPEAAQKCTDCLALIGNGIA